MFYLFGSTGKAFHGTLEALRRVEKTSALSSVQKVTNSGDVVDPAGVPLPPGDPSGYTASSNKAKQYGDMLAHVRRIATLLVEKNLDAIPIAEESGRLVGIVSRTDILKCTIADPPLSLWC